MRLESAAVRTASHSNASLDERHRNRLRLSSEFVNHSESSSSNPPLVSKFENTDSNPSCTSGDTVAIHNRTKPPSPEIMDVKVKMEGKQPCSAKPGLTDAQSHVVKRRHGRLSPHLQPYARNKPARNAVNAPDNNASSSSSAASVSPHYHSSSRRHHVSWDDQKPVSPPVCPTASASRGSRRRQRIRSDSKEEKDRAGNNSDDEHDDLRLQRLNQGIDYEEVGFKYVEHVIFFIWNRKTCIDITKTQTYELLKVKLDIHY